MDDLVFIAETLSELLEMFHVMKSNSESKVLRMNVSKTSFMTNAHNAPKPVDPSRFPCDLCSKSFGFSAIKCFDCGFKVHKCCTYIKGLLKPSPDFKCTT